MRSDHRIEPIWIRYDPTPRSDVALWIKALRLTGRDFFEQMLYLVSGNLLAMVLLPLVLLTPPLLWSLWWVAAQAALEEPCDFRAMGRHAWREAITAWQLALFNFPLYGLLLFNLITYGTQRVPLPAYLPPSSYEILLGGTVALLLLWSVYSLFVTGWMSLHRASLRVALREAAVLMIHHPLYAILLSVVIALLALLNALLPSLLFVLTWGLLAPLAVRSVQLLAHGVPIPSPQLLENQGDESF